MVLFRINLHADRGKGMGYVADVKFFCRFMVFLFFCLIVCSCHIFCRLGPVTQKCCDDGRHGLCANTHAVFIIFRNDVVHG